MRFNFFLKCVILLPNLMYFKKKFKVPCHRAFILIVNWYTVCWLYEENTKISERIAKWCLFSHYVMAKLSKTPKQSCPLIGIVLVSREYAENKESHAFIRSRCCTICPVILRKIYGGKFLIVQSIYILYINQIYGLTLGTFNFM